LGRSGTVLSDAMSGTAPSGQGPQSLKHTEQLSPLRLSHLPSPQVQLSPVSYFSSMSVATTYMSGLSSPAALQPAMIKHSRAKVDKRVPSFVVVIFMTFSLFLFLRFISSSSPFPFSEICAFGARVSAQRAKSGWLVSISRNNLVHTKDNYKLDVFSTNQTALIITS